jgi:ATP-dependent DNA ligase
MKMSKVGGKNIHFPQLRGSADALRYPAIADVKYDGEFNYAVIRKADVYTINKYGTMRRDFTQLNEIDKVVREANVSSAVFACELFWGEGKLGALYDLLSRKKDNDVKLRLFDLIEINGENMRDEDLVTRREMMFEMGVKQWMAESRFIEDESEAMQMFADTCNDGYEGIVLKDIKSKFINGPCSWVKLKKKDQNECAVTAVDPGKERIEIMYVSLDPNGDSRSVGVGVKAPDKYKKHIKVGSIVTIEHQGVLDSGSLRHPVLIPKKEWK